jgi:hypothetical protein
MAKKMTFTVSEVPGAQRTSARNYTHALIGKFNHGRAIALAGDVANVDKVNFEYWMERSKMKGGDRYTSTTGVSWIITQEDVDSAKRLIEGYSNGQEYAVAMARGAANLKTGIPT